MSCARIRPATSSSIELYARRFRENAMTPVLVTRTQPGASITAGRLSALGFAPVVAPLLAVRLIPRPNLPLAAEIQAVLVTSGHALPSLAEVYTELPLFAVGDATSDQARRQGFSQVQSADGNAADLAKLARLHLDPAGGPLLLAVGAGRGQRLAEELTAQGFTVLLRAVYAAEPVSRLPEAAGAFLAEESDGWILLFSAETATCFRRLVIPSATRFSRLRLAAISNGVALKVRDLPWGDIRVAMKPTETAVLALLHE
jgi:uroporphyrinogen-III synthase